MEMKFSFDDSIDFPNLHDSMQLDSNIQLCELEIDDFSIEIRVQGEVDVEYKGTSYRTASDFPDELLAKFANATAYHDEDTCIIDNNWFEIFTYYKSRNLAAEVIDVDGETPDSLFISCWEKYQEFRDNH